MVGFVEAKGVVEKSLSSGELALLIGQCRVQYQGRAASKLSEGDRLLVIKSDGTFLLHQSKGMKAINYSGPGSEVTVEIVDGEKIGPLTASTGDPAATGIEPKRETGRAVSDPAPLSGAKVLLVSSKHSKPVLEHIHVYFSRIDFVQSFALRDDSQLKLFGTERELRDLMMQDLEMIEPGLKPLQRETKILPGSIDILAEDYRGRAVVVEIKRRQAGLDAVTQLHRYVNEVGKRLDKQTRGILCAPGITENAQKMLERHGLEYYKLDYEIRNPSARIVGLEKKQRTLEEFGQS